MSAGGILLLPVVFLHGNDLLALNATNLAAVAYLSFIGAGLTYALWFRGIAKRDPNGVSQLAFLSPVAAVTLGLIFRNEMLTPFQWAGMALIFASILLGQPGGRAPVKAAPPA